MEKTSRHLLNAETQIAKELEQLVARFVAAKSTRLSLAGKIVVKARELAQASEMIHASEPALPVPIPPLEHPLVRERVSDEAYASKLVKDARGTL